MRRWRSVRAAMCAWWHDEDRSALDYLTAPKRRAVRGPTRRPGSVIGDLGEWWAWDRFGGTRRAQADGRPDINMGGRGPDLEVKATARSRSSWSLGKRLKKADYVLVRFDPLTWRVIEAWRVPLVVLRRHVRVSADGLRNSLPRRGAWQDEADRLV